jgi:hypothetical protein
VDVEKFITKWKPAGGNERANTQLFITDLCQLLGVEAPRPTLSDTGQNDYVFERHVIKTEIDGTTSNGWIDCYKRGSFILEAKQGSSTDLAAVDAGRGASLRDFFGQTAEDRFKRGMARRDTSAWTGAMQRAAAQAEAYAKNLPRKHGWPPFLLISDVGYCIDIYADFQRSGKGYAPFPDRRRYRITLEDLRDEAVRERLAAIWSKPMSLDPSVEAARVTQKIADHLATLARGIETREEDPDRVAAFLMRLLFTMFCEDTGLIPNASFSALLKKVRERPELLAPQLSQLWEAMNTGGLAFGLGEAGEIVRQFNGYLFKDTTALALNQLEIDVLIDAAASDWRQVEPAIFGTLLERALHSRERAKLGAHFTPRAYVERLVGPTVMEPLRAEWEGARTAATLAAEAGDKDGARLEVERFHAKLANIAILDPACGTGNFLYVTLARLKELEGEVLELLEALGDERYLSELGSHTITPANFHGLEINPRAAQIAQLVLWIGYLQWHFRVNGEDRMPEPPVLRDVRTIVEADALLDWDERVPEVENGEPKTIWDGTSMKPHPVTGRPVPDHSGRRVVYRYVNPRRRVWPKADFIIGNPPFIGCRRMRKRLGSPYVDALRRVYNDLSGEIDFVTYWWARSAELVADGSARGFGLITTKTIAQSSNRSVLRHHLDPERGGTLYLTFAIPNHPWHDQETTAAVRIAMTAAALGPGAGRLSSVVSERRKKGQTLLEFDDQTAPINVDLTVGPNVAAAAALKANAGICRMGVKMSGDGFKIDAAQRVRFLADGVPESRMPLVVAGTDVTERQSITYALDFFDIATEDELHDRYPTVHRFLFDHVKPERDDNDREQYRIYWWRFAEPRPRLRNAIRGLRRYIVTSETATERFFKFIPSAGRLVDGSVIAIASDDPYVLGIVSSTAHTVWALRAGGRMGSGDDPRYQNETCFDPFPFPPAVFEVEERVRTAARKLDRLRRKVLSRNPDLTLTSLYTALAATREAQSQGTVLEAKHRSIAERGEVSLIRHYHQQIDEAVAEAYGWPSDLDPEAMLTKLIALNEERAEEERAGQIRWVRPSFQAKSHPAKPTQTALQLRKGRKLQVSKRDWPNSLPDQVVAVASVVSRSNKPLSAQEVSRVFKSKRATTVAPVLDALAGMGMVRKLEDGRYAA